MLNYEHQPAFPPQVAQDNLGRLIAPIPGMTKLEFFSVILLPTYIQLLVKKGELRINGQKCTAFEAAIWAAKQMIDHLNDKEDETHLHIAE